MDWSGASVHCTWSVPGAPLKHWIKRAACHARLASYRHGRFDGGVRIVAGYLKIFKRIAEDIGGFALDVQLRIRARCARELQLYLLVVVAVNVAVTARPDEFADL